MLYNQLKACLTSALILFCLITVPNLDATDTVAPVKVAAAVPLPEHFANSIGMKLIGIPAGEYLCYGKAIKPQLMFPKPKGFNVKIERSFYIGETEVTREQYQKVMGDKPAESGKLPVNMVSWNESVEFCRKLSELPEEKAAGRIYSLPTEREWQYAARAGSEYMFTYGSDDETRVAEVAVCRDIYTNAMPKGVQAVGTKKPNAWGLYDVLGNVWEWVQDPWPSDQSPSNASPALVSKGDNRVIVGGGWDNDFRMCNLAARYSAPPGRKADNIGFRVLCRINKKGN